MHLGFVAFAGLLLVASWGLMWWHLREWRNAAADATSDADLDAATSVYRRRMQAATLIGLLSGAVFAGQWVREADRWAAGYWLGVLALVAWLIVLALADAVASFRRLATLRAECRDAREQLWDEIDRIRREADDA